MARVNFIFKTGRVRAMSERDARLLQRLGKGRVSDTPDEGQTYRTRDLRDLRAGAPLVEGRAVQAETKAAGDDVDPLDDTPPGGAEPAALDAEGAKWDPDLHTADQVLTRAGTWRKKPGAKASA